MHRVLIPIDGSETSLRAVRRLALLAPHLQQTEALLLNVQHPVAMSERIVNGRPSEVQSLEAPLREAGIKLLAPVQAVLDKAGIPHAGHVGFGDPAATIAEFASKHHCEQIIMGTHGLGAIASLVMGSVATKVLHLASVPVMLVK
jgi:nucleotide-binding universal stress UspA family protein